MSTIVAIVGAVVIGAAFGIVGYWSKRDEGEQFNPKKFGRTVILYAAAGFVIATGDGVVTETALSERAQILGGGLVGALFDMVWSRLRRS